MTRSPTPSAADRQTRIEWERGTQLAILREAVLPGGRGVSAITLKAVLHAIDDHARKGGDCWATQETIAQIINAGNVRTVKRAISILDDLSLITCERRKVGYGRLTINHYRIVWTELALLRPTHNECAKQEQSDNMSPVAKTIKVTIDTDQSDNYDRSKGHPCHFPRNVLSATEPLLLAAAAEVKKEFSEPEPEEAETIMAHRSRSSRSRSRHLPQPLLTADSERIERETIARAKGAPLTGVSLVIPPVALRQPGQAVTPQRGANWSGYDQDRCADALQARGIGRTDAESQLIAWIAAERTPEDFDALLETYDQQRSLGTFNGCGALLYRLREGVWPAQLRAAPGAPAAVDPLVRKRVIEAKLGEWRSAANHAHQAATAELLRQAEADHGATLDAMPRPDRDALMTRFSPSYAKPFFRPFLSVERLDGMFRQEALQQLAIEAGTDWQNELDRRVPAIYRQDEATARQRLEREQT